MPAAKRATKRPTKRTSKRTAKRTAQRKTHKLTAEHKAALARGRTLSATVDAYLKAIHTPKTRGRKVTPATIRARLAAAKLRRKTATGLDLVLSAQEVRDCEAKLRAQTNGNGNVKALEAGFVKAAPGYSAAHGIGYGAWRDAGVPATVLRQAGIARTRG